MIHKEDIIQGLHEIGIMPGMILEVHSSLRSFGRVDGGASTVIEALQTAVTAEGSIFMPALRLSPAQPLSEQDKAMGIVSKIRILSEDAEHTAMGLIADTFRFLPDVIVGEGVFRIAGWGEHAKEVQNGGLRYAIAHGGKGLLLGVDIYKLTAMHTAEKNMPQRIRDIFAPSASVNELYPPEEWLIETGEPPVQAWYTIQQMAYEQGLITCGNIGDCPVMFFDLHAVVELYQKELAQHPYRLYGLEEE